MLYTVTSYSTFYRLLRAILESRIATYDCVSSEFILNILRICIVAAQQRSFDVVSALVSLETVLVLYNAFCNEFHNAILVSTRRGDKLYRQETNLHDNHQSNKINTA